MTSISSSICGLLRRMGCRMGLALALITTVHGATVDIAAQSVATPTASATITVGVTDIEQALQTELTTAYALEGELHLQLGRPWIPLKGISPTWKLLILDKPGEGPATSMIVRCAIDADGKRVGTWNLPLRAEWTKPAWFAKRPILRGETLQMEDFELRATNCLREKEILPTDANLKELTASRAIAPGRALTWREVTSRILVQRGSQVDVIIRQGALSISMKAEALETGARGDRINLRNLQSRKNISAVIIDENLAQISL
ncbi:MAG: flagellar basal body P-ring formation chaperone FlgA [Verrucomicrobiota bacterium]|nr:flagellar basal body P-ring formation chaperone FlgA [Verrucomicrobiota bacterium]